MANIVILFCIFIPMIELEQIYLILESFLGESKQGGYDESTSQYQFNCCSCADEKGYIDGKYNLEVSLQKLQFHCWSCGYSGSLSKLIKKYGGKKRVQEYYSLIEEIKKSGLYSLDIFSDTTETIITKPILTLPKTFQKVNFSNSDWRVIKYLKTRNIDQTIVNKFNIGYTTWEEKDKSWANRIIIPSYDEYGRLNYFVGRDFMQPKKKKDNDISTQISSFTRIKYKNCDADKKEIVFQESLIDFDSDIVLVEGAIDCIYGNNTISLLGKSLTTDSAIFEALRKKSNGKIIICLDSDTKIEETKRIYTTLNFGRLKGKIWYIRLNKYKDFGELYEAFGKRGIIKAINGAKQFDEIELLW